MKTRESIFIVLTCFFFGTTIMYRYNSLTTIELIKHYYIDKTRDSLLIGFTIAGGAATKEIDRDRTKIDSLTKILKKQRW